MKILVSGASWTTESVTNKNFSWATHIRNELDCKLTNLAKDGFSCDYVTRSIMHNCEVSEHDYVVAMFPSIANRREMIVRDEAEENSRYEFLPISGNPASPTPFLSGKFLNKKKTEVLGNWEGYMMNWFDDQFNQLQNIILLGQYLKLKEIKHVLLFDCKPARPLWHTDCDLEVNSTLYRLTKMASNYISFNEYSAGWITEDDPTHWNNTSHPSFLGHSIIGDKVIEKIKQL